MKQRSSVREELARRLAAHLMQMQEGDRIPTVRQLASLNGTSYGSVSQALGDLEELGAVAIGRHGRRGSVIEARSLSSLWLLTGNSPLVIASSLPLDLRFEGLATSLKRLLTTAGIETYMTFIRGSRPRLRALRGNRCDAVVLSALAAGELCGPGEELVISLPPGSWVSEHCVCSRASAVDGVSPLRVAIDPDSFDHQRVTELEFDGQDVTFEPVPFSQVHRYLAVGRIDAAIWTRDEADVRLGPGFVQRPISDRVRRLVGDRSTSAVVIIRAGQDALGAMLKAILSTDAVVDIQERVLTGELVPEY